jgi:hypothetical protein
MESTKSKAKRWDEPPCEHCGRREPLSVAEVRDRWPWVWVAYWVVIALSVAWPFVARSCAQ